MKLHKDSNPSLGLNQEACSSEEATLPTAPPIWTQIPGNNYNAQISYSSSTLNLIIIALGVLLDQIDYFLELVKEQMQSWSKISTCGMQKQSQKK